MKNLGFVKMTAILFVVCVLTASASFAQNFTAIASFPGTSPFSAAVQGTNGNLYGEATPQGIGGGNVYEVTPAGTMTSISNLATGIGGLVLSSNGNIYGTDTQGGVALEGSIFEMNSSGTSTTIYSFCTTTCDDGTNPTSALVQVGGDIYGTNAGVIFKIGLGGAFTTLYSFCNPNCNQFGPPYPSALLLGSDGNFYGTTAGGNVNGGTVFRMTPSGNLTTLFTFSGPDGSSPSGSLVQGPNSELYGMTVTGGKKNTSCAPYGTCGTIFSINPEGKLTTLHRFDASDGSNPMGNLVLGTDGNFYGTTSQNGANGGGTIFQMSPSGKLTTIYNFCSQQFCLDGSNPRSALVQATNGTFYGTAHDGGDQGLGVFYSLSMGLAPFVQTMPIADKIGSNVIILGNNLTGTSSVQFNGTAAAFTVVSDTEITATVPMSATTGKVEVTTPSGLLASPAAFRVIQ
jgi:uncharacterized repeat protein (TIGR03803 family)